LSILVEGKIRRRRQDYSNNYGRYTGNDQQNNRFIVGGAVYQYPTAVNVINAGSYNPQQYDTYPDGGRDYYSKRIISILRKENLHSFFFIR
jgi:hypothetical protein